MLSSLGSDKVNAWIATRGGNNHLESEINQQQFGSRSQKRFLRTRHSNDGMDYDLEAAIRASLSPEALESSSRGSRDELMQIGKKWKYHHVVDLTRISDLIECYEDLIIERLRQQFLVFSFWLANSVIVVCADNLSNIDIAENQLEAFANDRAVFSDFVRAATKRIDISAKAAALTDLGVVRYLQGYTSCKIQVKQEGLLRKQVYYVGESVNRDTLSIFESTINEIMAETGAVPSIISRQRDQRVHMLVDVASLVEGASRVEQMTFASMNLAVDRVVEVVKQLRTVAGGTVVGTNDIIGGDRTAWTNLGFTVQTVTPASGGGASAIEATKQAVELALATRAREIINGNAAAAGGHENKIIFVTGRGSSSNPTANLLQVIDEAYSRQQWGVEVWSWDAEFSDEMRMLEQFSAVSVSFHRLDKYRTEIARYQTPARGPFDDFHSDKGSTVSSPWTPAATSLSPVSSDAKRSVFDDEDDFDEDILQISPTSTTKPLSTAKRSSNSKSAVRAHDVHSHGSPVGYRRQTTGGSGVESGGGGAHKSAAGSKSAGKSAARPKSGASSSTSGGGGIIEDIFDPFQVFGLEQSRGSTRSGSGTSGASASASKARPASASPPRPNAYADLTRDLDEFLASSATHRNNNNNSSSISSSGSKPSMKKSHGHSATDSSRIPSLRPPPADIASSRLSTTNNHYAGMAPGSSYSHGHAYIPPPPLARGSVPASVPVAAAPAAAPKVKPVIPVPVFAPPQPPPPPRAIAAPAPAPAPAPTARSPAPAPAPAAAVTHGGFSAEFVESITCPITEEIFTEPRVCKCNPAHVFERSAIEDWLSRSDKCPKSNQPLRVQDLTRNQVIESLVEMYRKANPL